MSQATVKTNYNRYRQNGGSWWAPYDGVKLFAGDTTGGTSYETVLRFDFSAYTSYVWNNATLYLYRFSDGQAAYKEWTMAMSATAGGTLINDSYFTFAFTALSAWKAIPLTAGQLAALKAGNQYIQFWGAPGNYAGIRPLEYSSGSYAAYIVLDYTMEPAPNPPTAYTPGTVTAESVTLDWSDGSDSRGIFAPSQLMYDVQLSLDGGASWGPVYTTGQGVTAMDVNLRSYVGYSAGTDYYNGAVLYRVRTHTPAFNGVEYYSGWAQSGTFAADYRYSSAAPGIVAPGTVTGDSVTFDWADVASQNGVYGAGQMAYDLMISLDGGGSWGGVMSTGQGVSYLTVNMRSYLGLQAGRYYINSNCKIAVRSKTPNGHYSGWAVSGAFAVDYRITPSAPAAPSLSKAAPYEGESITITVSRPSAYNALDINGAVNVLTYIVRLNGAEIVRGTAPVTDASKVLSYTAGQLTSGVNDLSASIDVLCVDVHGLTGPASAGAAATVKRFRAPTVVVTTIPRTDTTATVNITVIDTGYGGTQVSGQVRRILYKLASGDWTEATLGAWSGLSNSFELSGLLEASRYDLQVKAVNVAPDGTALSDKTGSAYGTTILEFSPATYEWYDSVTGGSGFATKALIVGADYGVNADPGWGVFQNGIKVGTNTVWHAGNLPDNAFIRARLFRVHLSDGTSINNEGAWNAFGFDYNTAGSGVTGPYISFGWLSGGLGYQGQIVAGYNQALLKYRTRNGDNGIWNPWFEIFHGGISRMVFTKNGNDGTYGNGHIELISTDNTAPTIGFHRAGVSAVALYYGTDNNLRLKYNDGTDYRMLAERASNNTCYVTNLYAGGNVSAASFTDYTPFYEGDALAEIALIKGDGKGNLYHPSLPDSVRREITVYRERKANKKIGGVMKEITEFYTEQVPGRDVGALTSMHTVAIQQLLARIKRLEEQLIH